MESSEALAGVARLFKIITLVRSQTRGRPLGRGRALPLARRMLPAMGCSEFSEQKTLLAEVAALMASSTSVTLLADREYGSVAMTRFCLKAGWHFCLRITPIKP